MQCTFSQCTAHYATNAEIDSGGGIQRMLGFLKSLWLLQVQGDTLFVANAGDSRCVVCEAGKAVPMSFDHKPTDEKEHSRIIKVSVLWPL